MSLLALDPITVVPAAPGSRRSRVLIGTDTFMPDVNGAAYFTYRLATGLAARGNDVHVVCPSDTGPSTVEYREGITVHRLRSRSFPLHPTMRFTAQVGLADTIAELIDRVEPDVVHVQGHFMVGRATIRAARRTGVPVVATNHFMPDNLMHHVRVPERLRARVAALGWRDAARVFSRADHVTTPTQIAANLFTDKGFGGGVEAVSCGIDLHRFTPGRVSRHAARLHLGLPDRPTVVFVMPGVAELQSIATLEAMASGLPVIAADAVALPHLVRDGDNGWLYRPGDVQELTGHLRAILTDDLARRRMGHHSRSIAAGHDHERSLARFEEIYSALTLQVGR